MNLDGMLRGARYPADYHTVKEGAQGWLLIIAVRLGVLGDVVTPRLEIVGLIEQKIERQPIS